MVRRLEWIESENFQGYGCSECDWKFSPSGAILHFPLDEMKKKYENERDQDFAVHICKMPKLPTR
jgi:hypothetical protein